MDKLKAPDKLDFDSKNLAIKWKRWKEEMELYLELAMEEKEESLRVKLFLYTIGVQGREVYRTFTFTTPDKDRTIKELFDSFEKYCNPKKNETIERYKFFTRNQESAESFDKYLTELRILMKTCNFGTLADPLLKDRVVCGIRDSHLRERLLREPDLTYDKCVTICKAAELSKERSKTLEVAETISKIKSKKGYDKRGKTSHKKQPAQQDEECKFCGRKHQLVKEKCPAYGKQCSKCSKMNHFAVKCRAGERRNTRVHQVEADEDYEEISSVTTSEDVNVVGEQYQRQIFATMRVNNTDVKFQLDSGATCNIISKEILEKVCEPDIEIVNTNQVLSMYNQTTMKPVGQCKVKVVNPKNGSKYKVNFVVLDEVCTPLLGSKAVQQMNLIKVQFHNIKSIQQNVSKPQNVTSGQQPITERTLDTEFTDVFEGIGCMSGTYHIDCDPEATPIVHPPRKVPVAMKEKLKQELDRLTEMNIIEPVEKPTRWVSSLVVANKPNGCLRVCLDPRDLNKSLKRSHYPMPVVEDVLTDLKKAKVFSTVDLKNGFWHVELDDESADLTTFNTSYGRYRWLRMPFGISTAPEEFQRRLHQHVEGLPGVIAIHDDILIFGEGENIDEALTDHDKNMRGLMQRCREKNLKLNREKVQLKQKQVRFMGHLLTDKGLQADPDKVKAVGEMPNPSDIEGVQRLLGFVNYLSKFLPGLSDVCEPLRKLTLKENEWCWLDVHQQAVTRIKQLVTQAPVLRYYDPKLELTLQCDASQTGLGAAIMQNGQPVAYASRSLTSAETRYAQIEKELLAVVFGMERFHQYTYGRLVKVQSDHKPLESILKKPLHSAPKRLQRMILRLQAYNIELTYHKGKFMYLADTLSRAYLPSQKNSEIEEELESIHMCDYVPISRLRLEDIAKHTKHDSTLQVLEATICSGWPGNKKEIPVELIPYFNCRDELSVQDGIIYRGERAIVPKALRRDMLSRIHSSHIGIDGCLRRARISLYWPGMSVQIKEYIKQCETCLKTGVKQQKETLTPHELPNKPWSKVGTDLFVFDERDYVITVDYYSNFWEVDYLESTKSSTVIKKLKAQFARYGIPKTVMSDNGPQYASEEFSKFSKKWDFQHVTSSPTYPQSNGMVESAVKTAKRLMRKAKKSGEDCYLSLLDFRNTPTQGMTSSPAQRLMSRRTRALLPLTEKLLKPKVVTTAKKERNCLKEKQAFYYDKHARDLTALQEGDVVRVEPKNRKEDWKKAVVISVPEHLPRSYDIETEHGQRLRRNRKHLKATQETCDKEDSLVKETESPVVNPVVNPEFNNIPETYSEVVQQGRTTRSGRSIQTPSYLKDYVT